MQQQFILKWSGRSSFDYYGCCIKRNTVHSTAISLVIVGGYFERGKKGDGAEDFHFFLLINSAFTFLSESPFLPPLLLLTVTSIWHLLPLFLYLSLVILTIYWRHEQQTKELSYNNNSNSNNTTTIISTVPLQTCHYYNQETWRTNRYLSHLLLHLYFTHPIRWYLLRHHHMHLLLPPFPQRTHGRGNPNQRQTRAKTSK
jgi:hypothetical protein